MRFIYPFLIALAAANSGAADDCYPPWPISSEIESSEATVIARQVSGEADEPRDRPADSTVPGTTRFEVVEVLKDATGDLEAGAPIEWGRYRDFEVGAIHLMYQSPGRERRWMLGPELSDKACDYVRNLPADAAPVEEQIRYLMGYLEHSDPVINSDAWWSLVLRPTEDIIGVTAQLDREKLRAIIASAETNPRRVGDYAILLGLCGSSDDAVYLEQWILEPAQELRIGIDGVMIGYLWLTGERGLELLEREKLADVDEIFGEIYGAMQAVRFLDEYGQDRIPRARLAASMRILLDSPFLVDIAISDLARWKDWSVIDRVYEMYDAESNYPGQLKRSIIRYLYFAQQAGMAGGSDADAELADKATRYLQDITQRDPRMVEQALRYVVPPAAVEESRQIDENPVP